MMPPLDHLVALTDDVGVLQHATYDVPNRSCGYCTDDVGRALIVACDAAARDGRDRDARRLVTTCLAFLLDAQLHDGWFHGFMGYDRRWQDDGGTPDAVGRAIWGLGYAEGRAPRASWRAAAGLMRRRALPIVASLQYVRSSAYAALGLVHALASAPDDALVVRATLDAALASIADAYDAHAAPDWRWCEDVLTYDNARLPEALIRGGRVLESARYVETGLAMLAFYADVTLETPASGVAPVFVPVGNRGWHPRGGEKSREGQQPIEAAAMVDAALAAYEATGEERWHAVADTAYAWFHGTNSHDAVLAADHGGCRDGLDAAGVNGNMGAESTISLLLSANALGRDRRIPTVRGASRPSGARAPSRSASG